MRWICPLQLLVFFGGLALGVGLYFMFRRILLGPRSKS